MRWQVGGSTDTDRHSGMGGWLRWQAGRQRQTRDGWVGGRDGKWVDRCTVGWMGGWERWQVGRQMHCGMDEWVGEMASG